MPAHRRHSGKPLDPATRAALERRRDELIHHEEVLRTRLEFLKQTQTKARASDEAYARLTGRRK